MRQVFVEGNIVALSLLAWNVGNYAFFLIAGRALGPVDYGFVAALLAAVVIASIPCGALQATVAQTIAAETGGVTVYRRLRAGSIMGGLAGTAAGVAAVLLVDRVVDIPVWPVVLTVASIAMLPLLLTGLGALQGRRRFGSFAVGFALWGVPRPLFLVPFVVAGVGVVGAMAATFGAIGLATAVTLWAARDIVRSRDPDEDGGRPVGRSLRALTGGLIGVAILTNVDVITAKLALADVEAGRFAAAAVLAKAILIVPQSMSFVLLPRVAGRRSRGGSTAGLLRVSAVSTVVASLLVAGLAVPAGGWALRITFGHEYVGAADLLPGFAIASGLLGVVLLLVNHQAALAGSAYGWALLPVGVAQIGAFALFHGSAASIIVVDACAALLGIAAHELLARRRPTDTLIGRAAR